MWTPQITDKEFVQHRCKPTNSDVVLIKAFTKLMAPQQVAIDCAIDYEVRQMWDEVLYDFRVF